MNSSMRGSYLPILGDFGEQASLECSLDCTKGLCNPAFSLIRI
jgi:hypothetical protein